MTIDFPRFLKSLEQTTPQAKLYYQSWLHIHNHNIKHVTDLDLRSTDGIGQPTTHSVQIPAWFRHIGNQYKDVVAPVNKHDTIEIDPLLKHQIRTEDELKM